MKRYAILLALVLAGACASQPTVDTGSGVSVESYKAVLEKTRQNLLERIRPGVLEVYAFDTTHSNEWKAVHLALIDDTATLISDALAGKNLPPAK